MKRVIIAHSRRGFNRSTYRPIKRPPERTALFIRLVFDRKREMHYIGIMTAPSGRIISGVQLPLPNTLSISATYASRRAIGTYA